MNKLTILSKYGALFTIALLCGPLATYAQDDLSGTVIVPNDIKVKLEDALKIDIPPAQDEGIKLQKPDMSYTTDPYLVPGPTYKTKLQPATLGKIINKELQQCFVKGAFGNFGTLYGEAFLNSLRNRTTLYSIDLKHYSGDGPVKNSGFSTNSVDLFGSQIFAAKYDLSASLGFRGDVNRFYATLPDSLQPKNASSDKQTFSDFHTQVHFANTGADTGALRYQLGVAYYFFGDAFKTNENDITVVASGDEPIKDNHIVADGSFDYMNYKNELSINRTLLRINAGYDLKAGILRAHLGFKTANETEGNVSTFHFYPDLRAEADLVEKYLTVIGGLTGNLEKNTFRGYAYENPFIVSDPLLKNTNEKFNLYGGVKGSFSSNSSFLVSVAFKNYHNMYFYIQDTTDRRKYVPVYDTGTTTVINVHGELAWSFMEDLDLSTKIDLNSYSVSTLKIQKPFERPAFEWMVTGNYNIAHKITFGADLFFVGSRDATDLSFKQVTTLKPYIDLNVHASYAFANVKGLKVFLELNNIFGNQYEVWNYYPVRGFQILGGVSYSFL